MARHSGRRGARGPRRGALVRPGTRATRVPALIPGSREAAQWEGEAALPGKHLARASSRGPAYLLRARSWQASPGSSGFALKSRPTFCPEPWANPAACRFWPRLGARAAGLDSFLDLAFSANFGERFQFSALSRGPSACPRFSSVVSTRPGIMWLPWFSKGDSQTRTKYALEKIHFISNMKWEVMLKLINYTDSQVVVRRIWDVSKILSRDLRGQNLSPYANNT